jgi:NarL family two-component system sensor histidine kinase LiaS
MATISPVWDEAGAIVGLMGIAKDLSVLKAVEEQRRMLARLEERESIAMDLHDNTMQALHGAVLGLAAAERTADMDVEQLRAALRQVREQLNGAIQELRNYVRDLHPHDGVRRCLSAGLVALAEQARVNARIRADVEIDESVEQLVASECIPQLLGIASEATFNAIRHARAPSVAMRLSREAGLLVLVISDDGAGFDTEGSAQSHGQGLANMSERARLMGARLAIVSRAGSGTQVRVDLPLGEDSQRE